MALVQAVQGTRDSVAPQLLQFQVFSVTRRAKYQVTNSRHEPFECARCTLASSMGDVLGRGPCLPSARPPVPEKLCAKVWCCLQRQASTGALEVSWGTWADSCSVMTETFILVPSLMVIVRAFSKTVPAVAPPASLSWEGTLPRRVPGSWPFASLCVWTLAPGPVSSFPWACCAAAGSP